MKKYAVLAICMIAMACASVASAENAGIGFEWNIGPQYPLVPYFSSVVGFNNSFILSWPVGDMTVGIFGETVRLRASRNYTVKDETLDPNISYTYTIISNGTMNNTGISLSTFLPGMDFLRLGMEIGTSAISTAHQTLDNGTAGLDSDWGTVTDIQTVSPLAGLMARWSLLSSKAKGIWTEISLSASMRFVPLPDAYPLGTMEARTANGDATVQTASFQPMTSFNHLNIGLGATIGF